MYTKQEIIIRSHLQGQSQRGISRELQISRKTVSKYIKEYERHLAKVGDRKSSLSHYLSKAPTFNGSSRQKHKLTGDVQEAIDKHLEENKTKLQSGLRKQLLKKCDIHEALIQQGFQIGYTTVCNYIRGKQMTAPVQEAFIRQQYQPGESCEFDWGEIKLYINGVLKRFQLAVFTSSYSNYRYAVIYQRQDTLAFMESHVRFFKFTGGVFRSMVYDNMRVAVAKFVGKYQKEPTQALLQLKGHYHFTHRFCNARRGNEKGHVERSVEFIRRKSFGVKYKFSDMEEAAVWLQTTIDKLNRNKQQLSGKSAYELFEEEKPALHSGQSAMACAEQIELRVDKYATVSYHTNRYSVPDHLVNGFVNVKISSNQIKIYQGNNLLATHERCYGRHQWTIEISHYLETFKRKPGALPGSVALASKGYLSQLYKQHFKDSARDFITVLDYCFKNEISDEDIEIAITRLHHSGVQTVNSDKLIALLGNQNKPIKETYLPEDAIAFTSQQQLLAQAALLN